MHRDVASLLKIIPAKLKLGPYDYELRTQKDWVVGEDGRNKWGLCSPAQALLTVGNTEGMPNAAMLVGIVLHEILHVFWNHQNLRPKETEENVILAFEVGLISLFRDNPEFLDWIKKGLK